MRRAILENVSDSTLRALNNWPLSALYTIAELSNHIRLKENGADLTMAIDENGLLHIVEDEKR